MYVRRQKTGAFSINFIIATH